MVFPKSRPVTRFAKNFYTHENLEVARKIADNFWKQWIIEKVPASC